jgi:saccharopine dehydrogenase-like NADP-dependent oxidoreductase
VRVAILGAGAEGSGLGALLSLEPDVDEIRLGDVDEARLRLAEERLNELGSPTTVGTSLVDGTSTGAVATWAEGVDVLVNATMPPTNLPTMRACVAIAAHYLDLFAFPFEIPDLVPYEQTIDAQFDLAEDFRQVDRVAISGAGVAPGWVDAVARYIAEGLDSLDAVYVRWVEWNDGKELISTVGPSLIANFNMPRPICWHDGRVAGVDLLDSEELYDWPELGPIPVYTGFLHPELRTIQNIGREIGHIEVKSGLSNGRWTSSRAVWVEALRRQLDSGAAADVADLPARLGASFIPPERYVDAIRDGIVSKGVFAVSVQVLGGREGQSVDHTVYLYVTLEQAMRVLPWATHMIYATSGTTPVVLVTMLGRGEIESRGVVGVGGLDEWRLLLARVRERGHRMFEHVRVEGDLAS